MSQPVSPERELIRRLAPFSIPAAAIAAVAGGLVGGEHVAWSAVIGIVVVTANLLAHGLSLAWAAKISLTAVFAVGLGGFLVRLGAIVAVMAGLNQLSWFSPVAFAASVVPTTILLLAFEMKLLAGRMQVDLWNLPESEQRAAS